MPEETALSDPKILRETRDNLIDKLGFGETYPVSDIETLENIKVPVEIVARIPLSPSQKTVTYLLCNETGAPITLEGNEYTVQGGDNAPLLTPPIEVDGLYTIKATKTHLSSRSLSTYLNQSITIKVGVDVSLALSFTAPGVNVGTPGTEPESYLFPFNSPAFIRVLGAQEQVYYHLLEVVPEAEDLVLSDDVLGLGPDKSIPIVSHALKEDLILHVRATRIFEDERENESELLLEYLYANFQANTGLNISISVDENDNAFINIENSQASVFYRILTHKILDTEISFDATQGAADDWLDSGYISDGDPLYVLYPDREYILKSGINTPFLNDFPQTYEAPGNYVSGTNGPLQMALPPIQKDTLYVIQTRKDHSWTNGAGKVLEHSSYDFLHQPLVGLAKPVPDTALRLRLNVSGHSLEVMEGEAGVFYMLSFQAMNVDETPGLREDFKAYFHHWETDAEGMSNPNVAKRGLGTLRLERDYVLMDDPQPRQLLFEPYTLPAKALLSITAEKGVTKIQRVILEDSELQAKSEITVSQPEDKLQVLVSASRESNLYTLYVNGQAVMETTAGTGNDLILNITDETLASKSPAELAEDTIIMRESYLRGVIIIEYEHTIVITLPPPEEPV